MADEHPWETFRKDKLPSGYAYPIGRERLEKELVAVGAHIGALYFSIPKLNPPNNPPVVIRLHWPGNSRARYFDGDGDNRADPNLIMWVEAVPSSERARIRERLEDGALSRVCRWAAELMSNPSSPSLFGESELYLTWSGTALAESPTWPPKESN